MSCFESTELRRQRIHSMNIDLQLKEEKKRSHISHKILVLGSDDSEKSTIVKNIKIFSNNGYSISERREEARNVRSTIRHIIQTLIDQMENQAPPSTLLCDQSNIPKLQYIMDNINHLPLNHSDFPRVFYEYCDALWQDEGMKQCFSRHQNPMISDCAEYFMQSSKLLEVSQEDYVPSDSDILKAREWNPGLTVTNVIIGRVHFEFLEINHEMTTARRWLQHIYSELTAVLFVVNISSYNVLSEGHTDKTENKVAESLAHFKEICVDNKWLRQVSVILFLNGIDRLERKVVDEDIPVADYFPEFERYRPPRSPPPVSQSNSSPYQPDIECLVQEPGPLKKAKCFFEETFSKTRFDLEPGSSSNYYHCNVVFTSANDSENITRIFESTRDIVMRIHLERWELL